MTETATLYGDPARAGAVFRPPRPHLRASRFNDRPSLAYLAAVDVLAALSLGLLPGAYAPAAAGGFGLPGRG